MNLKKFALKTSPSRGVAAASTAPKTCVFCDEKLGAPDAEDGDALRRFLSPQAKMLPRRKTGTCATHQRQVARAIKRARELGSLSYAGQRRS